jgi:hypothetical protein
VTIGGTLKDVVVSGDESNDIVVALVSDPLVKIRARD